MIVLDGRTVARLDRGRVELTGTGDELRVLALAMLRSVPELWIPDPDDCPQRSPVLARLDGNVTDVQAFLGKDRKLIYRWLQAITYTRVRTATAPE